MTSVALNFLRVQDDTIVLLLEPLHGIFLGETVLEADDTSFASSLGDVITWKILKLIRKIFN